MADIKREMPKLNKDKYHDSSVINLRTREVTNVLSKEEIRARVQRHKRIVIARIIIIGILVQYMLLVFRFICCTITFFLRP